MNLRAKGSRKEFDMELSPSAIQRLAQTTHIKKLEQLVGNSKIPIEVEVVR